MTRREVINLFPEPQRSYLMQLAKTDYLDFVSGAYNKPEEAHYAISCTEGCKESKESYIRFPYWAKVEELAKAMDMKTPVYPPAPGDWSSWSLEPPVDAIAPEPEPEPVEPTQWCLPEPVSRFDFFAAHAPEVPDWYEAPDRYFAWRKYYAEQMLTLSFHK